MRDSEATTDRQPTHATICLTPEEGCLKTQQAKNVPHWEVHPASPPHPLRSWLHCLPARGVGWRGRRALPGWAAHLLSAETPEASLACSVRSPAGALQASDAQP